MIGFALTVVQLGQYRSWTHWLTEPLGLNWPLVAVGVGAIWAALRTLGAIDRQARIMDEQRGILEESVKVARDNAAAAKANAEALVNGERAWILVHLRWEQLQDRLLKLVNTTYIADGVAVEGTHACVDCVISNNGRSPAWIIEKRITIAISETIAPEPDLHLAPVSDPILEPIAVNGESVWHAEPGCNGRPEPCKITIIYGSVKYRDIFDKIRETRFGYMVSPSSDLERIPSYPAYNKYT